MSLPVYHDQDCDLSVIRGKRVLVIGYGSQGRTQALNARDSGVARIKVALKPDSATRDRAKADGFEVVTVGEGVRWADVIVVLTSDEAHRDLFAHEIAPNLRAGQALVFAHGLSILTLDRIYHTGKGQLDKIGWFAALMGWVVALRDWAFGWVKHTAAWQAAARTAGEIRLWFRNLVRSGR